MTSRQQAWEKWVAGAALAWAAAACAGAAAAGQVICDFESLRGMNVTWGAKISPTIELSADRRYVTQGHRCVHLKARVPAGAKGNTYIGFRLPLAAPVDLRHKLLRLDAASPTPDLTRALYLRAYDVEGRRVLSFSCWRAPLSRKPKTFELLPGYGGAGFTWEASMIDPKGDLSRVAEIEVIVGTGAKGVVFEAYVDNLVAEATDMRTWDEVTAPKKLQPDTPLVVDGKPQAVILAPAGRDWDQAVAKVADALQDAAGVPFPVRRVATVPELLKAGKLPCSSGGPKRDELDAALWGGKPPQLGGKPVTAIMLGNVADNAAMLYLYSHSFFWADHFYPGPGGWEIRTVHDPWGKGVNALVVAASDPQGLQAAVPQLSELLASARRGQRTVIVPRYIRTHLAGKAAQRFAAQLRRKPTEAYIAAQKRAAEQRLKRGAHTGLFGQVAAIGDYYIRTRKTGYAQLFVWLVRRAYEHYKTKPKTYGGPWGMDSDFMVHRVLPAWDVVEEDPSLTDQQRWQTTQILFRWVSEVAVRPAAGVVGSSRPRFNHQTFPALGLMYASEYFAKYYNIVEARKWLKIADECFQFQAKCFKSNEDCNGYQWLTWGHTLMYALARPDFAIFMPRAMNARSGGGSEPAGGSNVRGGLWQRCSNARRVADYTLLGTDSFGYAATYGDTGSFQGWWSELPVLQMINFVLHDPGYQWVIQRKIQRSGRIYERGYYVTMQARPPQRLVGTHVFPLDPYWWKAFGGQGKVELSRAVDKVCMRSGFDDGDDYIILDGLKPGGHRHFDVNAISRVCLADRIWVADASYFNQAAKYHSTAFVLRQGLAAPHPDFAELGHAADLPACGATETVLRDYNGCDWHRWLIWRKGLGLVVADRFVARRSGDYTFRIYWQLLGRPRVEKGRVVLQQIGRKAALLFPADAQVWVCEDRQAGKNWAGYPYLRDPAVQVVQLSYDAALREGEQFVAWSLLTAGDGVDGLHLVRSGAQTIVVTGPQQPGRWPAASGIQCAPGVGPAAVRHSAAAWLLWPTGAVLVDAGGSDLKADFHSGTAVVSRPALTRPDQMALQRQETAAEVRARPDAVTQDLLTLAAGGRQARRRAQPELPQATPAWVVWPKADAYVLTGNRETEMAAACLKSFAADPPPLEKNIFGGEPGTNALENLFDGKVASTRNCVMWPADKTVTLTLTLDGEYELTEADVQAWFATSSSKGAKFQLAEIVADVSSDGFRHDVRQAGRLADTKMHANWGGKAHRPESYRLQFGGVRGSALRLTFRPQPGTAVYLAEVCVRGRGGPLATVEGLSSRILSMTHFTCLTTLGTGASASVVGGRTDGEMWRVGADGRVLWKRQLGRPVLSVAVVRFDGRTPTIVCGCRDGLVVALAPDGEELWRTQLEYYKQPPHVRVVIAADFSGHGRQTAVVGADSWRYYALDASGKVLWHYESVHVSTAAAAADIDGDGRDEVALGTNYHWWAAVRGDGTKLWGYSTKAGPECTAVAAGDLDGDGKAEVAFGVADGTIQVVGPDGKLKWMVDTSDAISFLAFRDVTGDGRPEVVATSANGMAYALDAAGKIVWHTRLGPPATAACVAGGTLAAGCGDGVVRLLALGDGHAYAAVKLTGEPTAAAAAGERAFIATRLGQLAAVDCRR